MDGTKLIRMCEVGYKVLHSFDEDGSTTLDDIIYGNNELFERMVKQEKVINLYVAKFKDNYLIDVMSTVFAPMYLDEKDRNEFEFDYDWNVDIPFSGTAYEIQKHINGAKWCNNYHGDDIF